MIGSESRGAARPHQRRAPLLRYVLPLAGLVAVYSVDLVSLNPWDLAIGLVIALGFFALFGPFLAIWAPSPVGVTIRRIVAFPRFAFAVVRDIAVGTVQVAAIVLGRRPLRAPGIVAVPIGDRTPLGVAVTALSTTLSPGSFLVDVDVRSQVMLIHVIDATDPDRVRRTHEHFYERYQRQVFP